MHNSQPVRHLRRVHGSLQAQLEHFDSLPRDQKEVLWDAFSGKLHASGFSSVERLRAKIEEAQRKSTREVYGPDHPQAERSKAENLLADIGLL